MGTMTNGLTEGVDYAYNHYFLANPFLEMLKSGEIDEEVVNDKVRRILRLMYRTNMNPNRTAGSLTSQQHFDVAREVAQEGIVLLKNNRNFFPVDPATSQTIAIIGENATRRMTIGGGSSELKTKYEISPLSGLKKRFANANILYSMGYSSGPSAYGEELPAPFDADSLLEAAVEAAAKADMVLFIGGLNKNHFQDCEGEDRKAFNLPFGQDKLLNEILKVNKNVGVILISGNAVDMPWLPKVNSVLQAWYLGSEAGNAIADIISGDVNPSGKLPFSFPVKLTDNAAHSFGELSYPGDSINQYYKEDILVGYRWHDTKNIAPLFAFGHGLSYTSFKISNAKTDLNTYKTADTIAISCDVQNTGKTRGAEVIQIYVKDEKASVLRPEKELKAFQKVFLEPGEKQTVELQIPVADLAFYDETKSGWTVEPGVFQILLGTSSRNLKKTIKVDVD